MLETGCPRMRRERLRAPGSGPGRRQSGESPMARAGGTLSLPRMPRAVRREPALLGAEWRSRSGLSALDLAGLEDASARYLDQLDGRAAAAQPAKDREQRPIFDSARRSRQRISQQNPG